MEQELKKYYQKGDIYIIPIEEINYWVCEFEELKEKLSVISEKDKRKYDKYCYKLRKRINKATQYIKMHASDVGYALGQKACKEVLEILGDEE